ncbi:MAG: ATP-binding protein [Acidimicrobiia bacterium]
MQYVPRFVESAIEAALADTRVVVVNGARQAGKSTLVRRILRSRPGSDERRLDRPLELAAARLDPDAFVRHDGLLAIDEIQRAPELVLSIKDDVDLDPRPGRFLLTGSARVLGLRSLPDALVGRTETIELWPFAQAEIEGSRPDFVDALLRGSLGELTSLGTPREEYFERLTRGGFPEAVKRDARRRGRFFESYVDDLIDRDVSTLGDIGRRPALRRLVGLAAATVGQLYVPAQLARAASIDAKTADRYISLFEEVFLFKRVPAWTASSTKRAVGAAKLLAVDTGLGADLVGRSPARLVKGDPLAGPLLENFALSEIARLLPVAHERARLFHFRTKDGVEVDGVVETRDRRIAGIEVKAAESVRGEDLRGLTYLRDRVGEDFVAGVVLYTGRAIRSLGDRLWAVPLDCLWSGAHP